jgi:hypothetical protein
MEVSAVATAKTRTCVACGRSSSKGDLVRFVRSADGTVELDPTGRKPGRGAYLCPDRACFASAHKRHGLDRALKTKIDEEAYGRLAGEFDPLCPGHGEQ